MGLVLWASHHEIEYPSSYPSALLVPMIMNLRLRDRRVLRVSTLNGKRSLEKIHMADGRILGSLFRVKKCLSYLDILTVTVVLHGELV